MVKAVENSRRPTEPRPWLQQKAKGKRQKAKGKRQKAKGKRQKAKGKRQKAKGRRHLISYEEALMFIRTTWLFGPLNLF
jgi:hypothetical protein